MLTADEEGVNATQDFHSIRGDHERHRHQLWRFIRCIAVHDALIARAS